MRPAVGTSSAGNQLYALLTLRRDMVRSGPQRLGFALFALGLPAALLGVVVASQLVPEETAFELTLVTPTLFLAFAVISLLSPLASGGGQDLYPAEQLVAMPIRASTQFLSGLLVLPLNIAWVTQLLAVCAAAFLQLPLALQSLPAVLVLSMYVLAVSSAGQLVAWVVIGLRRSRRGRVVVGCVAMGAAVGSYTAVRLVGATDLLDASPTTAVVIAVLRSASGGAVVVLPTVVVLLACSAGSLAAGWRVCGWALRRPGDAGVFRESRPQRRQQRISLAAVDRNSVWRSPPIRRGVLVLGLLPGVISAVLGVDWSTLVLLPCLVAAGAGLLFGVNTFCLDGTGAVWLASMPHPSRVAVRAKTLAIAGTCAACMLLTVVAASLRVDRPPTMSDVNALACSMVVGVVWVVSMCLRLSTTRPHKAELRGPRDTPAPPGAMAVYSLRLAVVMTLLGMALSGTARLGIWWLPWLVGAPTILLALRRIADAWSRWEDPLVRARVVMTVAQG